MMRTATDLRPILRRYRHLAPRYDRTYRRYTQRTLAESERLLAEHARRSEPHTARDDNPSCADRAKAEQPRLFVDVACGTGVLIQRMRWRWPQTVMMGVDLSPDMLRRARTRAPEDDRTKWRRGGADRLPVDDGAADALACTSAFHLVPDQTAALEEFRRVLAPGGVLVIVDWDRHAPTMRAVATYYDVFGRHPRQILSREELGGCVARAGFEFIESTPLAASWFWRLAAVAARKR